MLSPELCAFVVIMIGMTCYWVHRWRNPRCSNIGGILPPGSMGIPFIGETLQLIIPSHSLDLPPFIKHRLERYGPLFRTNAAGRNVVVSADPEFNYFIFQQEGKLVESWYLDTFAKLFKQGNSAPDAAYIHKYTRNLVLSHFGTESLRQNLLSQVEKLVDSTLRSWSNQASIDVKFSAATMTIGFGAKQLFDSDDEKSSHDLVDNFVNFSKCLMSFPLNIPGTAYHSCLQGKKKLIGMILTMVRERCATPEKTHGDLLDHVLKDMNTEKFLTEDVIAQVMFGILYVSFDSLSSIITLAIKLLEENPLVLEALASEHEAILKERGNLDSSITWKEYKSMTFTLQVINETLRLGSVSPGFLRRAKKDIHVNGYTIPAGWAIMAANLAVQLDPMTFNDPLAFNPWRWKELKENVIAKNFKPFGGGMKQCAGAEYSRVLLSTFLHILVTKYKWTKIGGGDVARTPMLQFHNSLRIKVSQKK